MIWLANLKAIWKIFSYGEALEENLQEFSKNFEKAIVTDKVRCYNTRCQLEEIDSVVWKLNDDWLSWVAVKVKGLERYDSGLRDYENGFAFAHSPPRRSDQPSCIVGGDRATGNMLG